jgi:hypothetical protein
MELSECPTEDIYTDACDGGLTITILNDLICQKEVTWKFVGCNVSVDVATPSTLSGLRYEEIQRKLSSRTRSQS